MKNEIFPLFECGVYFEDAVWGVPVSERALYKVNVQTGMIEQVVNFDVLEMEDRPFVYMFQHQKTMILIPGKAEHIMTYHMDTEEIQYFHYLHEKKDSRVGKFSTHIIYGEFAYIFPARMEYILKLNLQTMERQYIYDPINDIRKKYEDLSFVFDKETIIIGEWGIIPCRSINYCLLFNLCTMDYMWLQTGKEGKGGYAGIAKENNDIYILSKENILYTFCWMTKKVKSELNVGEGKYSNICIVDDMIWLIPADRGKVKYSYLHSKEIIEVEYPSNFKFSRWCDTTNDSFRYMSLHENKIYIIPRCGNCLLMVDCQRKEIKSVELKYADQLQTFLQNKAIKILKEKKQIQENAYGLSEFFEYIKSTYAGDYTHHIVNVGEKIHTCLKR